MGFFGGDWPASSATTERSRTTRRWLVRPAGGLLVSQRYFFCRFKLVARPFASSNGQRSPCWRPHTTASSLPGRKIATPANSTVVLEEWSCWQSRAFPRDENIRMPWSFDFYLAWNTNRCANERKGMMGVGGDCSSGSDRRPSKH